MAYGSRLSSEEFRRVLRVITVFVDNGLDQPVTVQLRANRVRDYAKSVSIGSAFTVGAGSSDARTLDPNTSGWLPYIMAEVWCSTAPTTGAVDVYLVRAPGVEQKLVDSLAIRDTNKHNPSTDPTKMFILEW